MLNTQLYSFFNSSTSYRVRIALALKNVPYTYMPVDIRSGQQRDPVYVEDINSSASVPALVEGDWRLGQSLAILDYLDARYPEPRLIPVDPQVRARVLEFCYAISCDIHPVNNLRVLKRLEQMGISDQQRREWYHHWVAEGLAIAERLLTRYGKGPYCFGAEPTLADCCLVPQIANALRMGCDVTAYAAAMAAYNHANRHPAFQQAEPQRQPDFVR